MAVSDGEHLLVFKELGLVSQVFDEATLATLQGDLGIGHDRYSTTGLDHLGERAAGVQDRRAALARARAQRQPGQHARAGRARRALRAGHDRLGPRRHAARAPTAGDLEAAALDLLPTSRARSRSSCWTSGSLFAARDPHGLRPLSIGRLPNGFVVASETCALDIVGAVFVRDVEPGELVRIDDRGLDVDALRAARSPGAVHLRVRLPRPPRLAAPRTHRPRGPSRAGATARRRGARRGRPASSRSPTPRTRRRGLRRGHRGSRSARAS